MPAEWLRAWIPESARPGLHSDSAPYHRKVWGKKLRLPEPQFPHLCIGVLGGARELMHGADSAQLPQNPVSPNKQAVELVNRLLLLFL